MKIVVKCANLNTELNLELEGPQVTVGQLKEIIASKCPIPAAQQRLIFSGRILKDCQTLESYGVKDGSAMHMVKGMTQSCCGSCPCGAPVPPSSTPTAPTATGLPPSFAMPQTPQQMMQMMQNPEFARQVFENPIVRTMMDNPEMMRTVLLQNPQMRALVDRNPELAHVLDDPALLRQTLEMARNPELMREMMRNADRAMSNLESVPEGFNVMRRAFTEFQEPIMDAVLQQAQHQAQPAAAPTTPATGQQQPQQPPSQVPNAQPLPNPWATPAQATDTPAPGVGVGAGAAPAAPGLGGLFGAMPPGGMPDMSQMLQAMQDPAMQSLMQQLFSNPQLLQQVMEMNPWTRQMLEANPQMRTMLQDPRFLQQMANPQTIQALMQLQQAFGGLSPEMMGGMGGMGMGMGMGMPGTTPTTGTGSAGTTPSPAVPQQPPEVRFAEQLRQLEDMGFTDREQNIRALTATSGNVQFAVERILSGR